MLGPLPHDMWATIGLAIMVAGNIWQVRRTHNQVAKTNGGDHLRDLVVDLGAKVDDLDDRMAALEGRCGT